MVWGEGPFDDSWNEIKGDFHLDSVRDSLARHRVVGAIGLDDVVLVERPTTQYRLSTRTEYRM